MSDRYSACSISVCIYPDGRDNRPLQGALSFRHKSNGGRCLSSCPFYRPGGCKIYQWMSDIDPMTFPPLSPRRDAKDVNPGSG